MNHFIQGLRRHGRNRRPGLIRHQNVTVRLSQDIQIFAHHVAEFIVSEHRGPEFSGVIGFLTEGIDIFARFQVPQNRGFFAHACPETDALVRLSETVDHRSERDGRLRRRFGSGFRSGLRRQFRFLRRRYRNPVFRFLLRGRFPGLLFSCLLRSAFPGLLFSCLLRSGFPGLLFSCHLCSSFPGLLSRLRKCGSFFYGHFLLFTGSRLFHGFPGRNYRRYGGRHLRGFRRWHFRGFGRRHLRGFRRRHLRGFRRRHLRRFGCRYLRGFGRRHLRGFGRRYLRGFRRRLFRRLFHCHRHHRLSGNKQRERIHRFRIRILRSDRETGAVHGKSRIRQPGQRGAAFREKDIGMRGMIQLKGQVPQHFSGDIEPECAFRPLNRNSHRSLHHIFPFGPLYGNLQLRPVFGNRCCGRRRGCRHPNGQHRRQDFLP